MHLLFLSRWYPWPPDNGSRLRIYHLLRALAGQHQVHLIAFTEEPIEAERRAALEALGMRVETVAYRPFQPGSWRAVRAFFGPRPRSVVDTFSPEMAQRVQAAVATQRFDLVIASEIDMAPYAQVVPGVPRLLEELELAKLRDRGDAGRGPVRAVRAQLTWAKLRRYVRHLLADFAACTAVSDEERALIEPLASGCPVSVIPNGVSLPGPDAVLPPPVPDTLIYTGALSYDANFEAVDFFLREIWPRIRAERPQATFAVTGRADPALIARLPEHPGVIFTGYLPDVRSAVAGSWLSAVALKQGGGTRLKVLESLALGTPVVATRKGAEGLQLTPGRDVLLADDPEAFAQACLRLLRDPALRADLSACGRQAVTRYDWGGIGQQLLDLVARTAGGGRALQDGRRTTAY